MKTKSLLFFHVFLMCFLVAIALPLEISAQQTSQIRNLNKNEDYETIQRAINDASVGDVIYVGNGLYNENVVVNKTLSLIGENRFNTIIDGGDSGNILLITADNVTVTGFTLQNSGLVLTVGGVYIDHSVHNKIIGNVMKNNKYGIYLSYSGGNSITNNTIFNNSYGIDLVSSTDNIITSNNLIYNNHGISLSISISNIFSENN
ncbi:right-handed parallel beta-helix repeat-containing protein, partial [Candidatus Bathyarchaeota archaeon]|nr:right-handed parallel beta-helix repeat-containing protein [Candidatus Bathyarchaeota archaeon]